jgi:hypothetical protein
MVGQTKTCGWVASSHGARHPVPTISNLYGNTPDQEARQRRHFAGLQSRTHGPSSSASRNGTRDRGHGPLLINHPGTTTALVQRSCLRLRRCAISGKLAPSTAMRRMWRLTSCTPARLLACSNRLQRGTVDLDTYARTAVIIHPKVILLKPRVCARCMLSKSCRFRRPLPYLRPSATIIPRRAIIDTYGVRHMSNNTVIMGGT